MQEKTRKTKTNRYWTVPQNMERSVKDIINNIEGNNETILTYDDIDINQITATVQTSPYISDQLFELKEKYFNEFLRLIGVANLSINKKERNIRDEITAMQGGTIASRYSRFETRRKAVEEINRKFNKNIIVGYYDGLPTNLRTFEETIEENESEVQDNDL